MKRDKPFAIVIKCKEYLEEKNLPISRLAGKLNISPSHLHNILKNRTNPSLQVVERMCELMDLNLDDYNKENFKKQSPCYPRHRKGKDDGEWQGLDFSRHYF